MMYVCHNPRSIRVDIFYRTVVIRPEEVVSSRKKWENYSKKWFNEKTNRQKTVQKLLFEYSYGDDINLMI